MAITQLLVITQFLFRKVELSRYVTLSHACNTLLHYPLLRERHVLMPTGNKRPSNNTTSTVEIQRKLVNKNNKQELL